MLDSFTGCVFTQPRKMSWMSCRVAVVLSDPGKACERETGKPACKSAFLEEVNENKKIRFCIQQALSPLTKSPPVTDRQYGKTQRYETA